MIVEEKIICILIDKGMSEIQAKEILKLAKPVIEGRNPGHVITWNSPAEEYPDEVYWAFWILLKPIALSWIKEHKPEAWFKHIFE